MRTLLAEMRRFAYVRPRVPRTPTIAQRTICSTFSLRVDKKKVDELLTPLSQKYADAKDEVRLAPFYLAVISK